MELRDFLLAMFNALPDKKIDGKKRLQKIVHLMKESGAKVNADYRILHYGPFSNEVADAVDELSTYGPIQESMDKVNVGSYDTYLYVYKLEGEQDDLPVLGSEQEELVEKLNNCSTTVLEVTSTISFYQSEGFSYGEAVSKTRYLKPTKTIEPVLRQADKILELINSRKS